MNAYFLLIKLPYSIEYLEKEVEALVARLPSGSRRVLYTKEAIGFLVPKAKIIEEQSGYLGPVMKAFASWWLLGVTGELICKDGSADPFRHWMNEFLGITPVNLPKREHIPLTERRKPRGERPVDNLVDRAVIEVPLGTPPNKDRS